MLRNRWLLVDRSTGLVTGVIGSDNAPDETDETAVVAHDTAEMGKHVVNLTTGEVTDYIHVPSKQEIRSKFTKSRGVALANSTVEYEGMVFDSDETSQNRMLRPITVLQNDIDTQLWVLHNNETVHLTRPQFIAVLSLAGQQQTSIWVQP